VQALDFFTWEQVVTGGLAAALVTVIVQFIKGFTFPMNPNHLRLGAYIVSVAVLNAAAFFTGAWNVSFLGLSFVNGILVTLAALGEYEVLKSVGLYKSSAEIQAMKAMKA
jgi:hypothetical protein